MICRLSNYDFMPRPKSQPSAIVQRTRHFIAHRKSEQEEIIVMDCGAEHHGGIVRSEKEVPDAQQRQLCAEKVAK